MKTDASAFFGGYRAGNSPAHRMPVWSKYLLVLLVGVTPFFVKQWWFSLGCLVVAVVINLVVARIPVRTALSIGVPLWICLLYTSPSPRDATLSRMPSSA